ncbi:hypothetical protein OQJ13_10120 [Legionella sp. PATHC035]|uniref:hypothetical protein n=1 Tax=Legionella sp. PATHC035 TaxID=2992040 RepID=UPI002242FD0A|nr:hypothetical protein [Legionella sp. PATHC035]MCW8409328.1 hypothetical protein [Legionella sp. PATHC035]
MATSKQIMEPWLVSKKKWESIFSLHLPKPAELLELMESWSGFRQMTVGLLRGSAKIAGSDKFFLDAQAFLGKACTFFEVQSPEKLPLAMDLAEKLREASAKVTTALSPSLLSVEIFKADFPKIITKAQDLKEEKVKQEEEREQKRKILRASDRVTKDPFFTAAATIQGRIEREIERIRGKNADDDRIVHLIRVKGLLESQINNAKEEYKKDYLSKHPGSKQQEIKSQCKAEMAEIVTHLMENKTLDIKFRTWLGRVILNLIIALPVKMYSKYAHVPADPIFFKLKTQAQTNIEEINEDIVKIELPKQ